jgi:hypothetical protein
MSKVPSDSERLSQLSKAIDDSILDASEKDLREEFAKGGDDFDKAVARIDSAIERAKARAGKMRFERAKSEAKAYREESNVAPLDLEQAPAIDRDAKRRYRRHHDGGEKGRQAVRSRRSWHH